MSGAKDLANPYLAGFGFSRPMVWSIEPQEPIYDGEEPQRSCAPGAITLDWYHHPSKRLDPKLRYRQAFDLYSYVQYPLLDLGVMTNQCHLMSTNELALKYVSLGQGIC